MKIKGVIFDLFGTLIRVERVTNPYKRVLELAEKAGYGIDEIRQTVLTKDLPDASSLVNAFGFTDFEREQFLSDLEAELQSVSLFREVPALLDWLHEEGYRIGLISNLASPYKKAFYRFALDAYIEDPVFSCDVGYIKPDPAIYEIARTRMGVQFDEMLMVGDKPIADVEGPRAAGMHALHLQRLDGARSAERIRSLDELRERLVIHR